MPRTGWTSQGLGFGNLKPPYWVDQTLSTPTYNVLYTDSVYAFGATNYSVVFGSLPTNFSINSTTGAFNATYTTPVNDSFFSYSFTIRASNSAGYVDANFIWNIDIPFTYTGGSSIYLGSGFTGRYFTSNGTFQILTGKKDLEVAVISGGSGGGGGAHDGYGPIHSGGGGGAGGSLNYTSITNATVGNYTIAVGGAGSGGARGIIYDYYGVTSGSQGGTGGTSTITKPDSSTITRSGPSGGNGATSYGLYYGAPYYALGGSGANNAHYSGTSGSTAYYSQYAGGGGGAGSGGNAYSIPNYYTGANGGPQQYIFDSSYAFGDGGPGGNWNSRNATSGFQAAGGAGGSGGDDATYGPGYAGNGGIILIRWST